MAKGNNKTANDRSILKALEFLALYADPAKVWPYKQIHQPNRDEPGELLLRASVVYPGRKFGDGLKFYSAAELAKNPARLLYRTVQTNRPGLSR